jgi:Icc-related predicted phosphoesterase
MRIQLLSDLHLEFYVQALKGLGEVQVDPRADAVVLAGDIAKGWASLQFAHQLAERSQVPVLWIPGNHEYYGQDYDELRLRFAQAELPGVHILMERSVTLGAVRFLGSTLWTDFALYEGAARLPTREAAMVVGQNGLNDFRVIRRGMRPFSAQASAQEHALAREFLERELRQPFAGRTVVVTHHAPCARSIHARFFADSRVLCSPVRLPGERDSWRINPCFASNLEKLLEHDDVWVHGHMHNAADYHQSGCRVVANPRGYPGWRKDGTLEFENPDYEPQLLIDV